MAKSKQAKAARKQEETVQQPTPPAQEGSEDGSDVEFVTEAELEKDEAEEELERLVFGDSEGFREGLRDFKLDDDDVGEDGDESDAQDGLEGMDDADVCYSLDTRSFSTWKLIVVALHLRPGANREPIPST
jgi:U3 small nucleolar RNA-associated protein 18